VVVIIFGVSGAGKTTIGRLVANELGWAFYDADDFHPRANIEKMKRGLPLGEADRKPWLSRLRAHIAQCVRRNENAVLACSALKAGYRTKLRISSDVVFVFLHGERSRIAEQVRQRTGHFMDPDLLDSQFADLEEPEASEGVLVVELGGTPEQVTNDLLAQLEGRRA
jgi:gluconokinase